MSRIRISVVAYLNSKPFIYGIEHSPLAKDIDLQLDIPSACANKLVGGQVDIGLVPVAVLPLLKEKHIISDYCIGAVGKVASVMLYSEVPLRGITHVLLDYQSRTSVTLVKVLAQNYWKIKPEWESAGEDYETLISGSRAAVIIGDRTFGLEGKYKYAYDLAGEWQKFTGLPFVFACWVANRELPADFIRDFNTALEWGLNKRNELIPTLQNEGKYATDVAAYLNHSISYDYDTAKKRALELFLSYMLKLGQ